MQTSNVFSNLPELSSPRLVLGKIGMDDALDVFEYASDPWVSQYVPWQTHGTVEESKTFIQTILDNYCQGQADNWALMEKATGKMVGTAGFIWWKPEHRVAEIGYTLTRNLWGKGLMTEAVREILGFGFETLGLNRVQAQCIQENLASARVMEKCGMKQEALLREYLWLDGEPRDYRIYSILRREWELL